MKNALSICLLACSLAACTLPDGSRIQTFYFDSNATVLVSSDGNESCYTPCQLDLEPFEPIYIHDQNYSRAAYIEKRALKNGANFKEQSESWYQLEEWLSLPIYGALLGPLGLPTTTTVAAFAPLVSSGVSTDVDRARRYNNTAIYYDTNSYYIYVSEAGSYVSGNEELLYYALTNFEQMQAEVFATEQAFIDAFVELLDMHTKRTLLLNSSKYTTSKQDIVSWLTEASSAIDFLNKLERYSAAFDTIRMGD